MRLTVLAPIVLCLGALASPPALATPLALASPTGVAPEPLTVFAASSLKESLDTVARAWTAQSGQKVVVSYAASSALAKQIEQAAPADVFISADREWMDYLVARKAADATSRFDLVRNRLVLVAPAAGGPAHVPLRAAALVQALGADGRLAVAETDNVPAGRYAKQSLTALGLWHGVSERLAPSENVRAALAFVARGESPLGIVYETDARAEPKVRVVARFPDDSHTPIVYPAARVAASPATRSAGFLAYLQTARARATFLRAGFSKP